MANEEYTLAELLKPAGYQTAVFGKWHLGDNYPFRPVDQGFDYSLVHWSGGIGQPGDAEHNMRRDDRDSSYFDPVLWENGEAVYTKGYCSDVYVDYSLDFINKNKDKPFFIYLAFNAPHTPLQVPQEYYNIYKDMDIDMMKLKQGYEYEMKEKDYESARRVYAMVTNIDDNMKRLFDKLKKEKIWDNTIVIFMTDNGPQQPRYRSGFRGLKQSTYEGGVHVPFFFKGVQGMPVGKDIETMAAHIDVVPTLCEYAGVKLPEDNKLDGRSLKPLLDGQANNWTERPLFSTWQRGYPQPYQNMSVIQGDYKLVAQTEYHIENFSGFQLYYLKDDPYEVNDISEENQYKVAALKKVMDSLYNEVIVNSENIGSQRAIVGTVHENPAILNRNDLRGAKSLGWRSEDRVAGYWDIDVVETGMYQFKVIFKNNFKREGKMYVRVGNVQRHVVNWDTTIREVTLPAFKVEKGPCMLEAWYQSWGDVFWPFYVEIERVFTDVETK
jgi:arylsulfatase